nr:DUF523 domain-containing protein [Maliibacterium massiliense]
MRLAISACLCGCRCRYDGGGYDQYPQLRRLVARGEAIAVCPEVLGGLPTPRTPCERRGARVVDARGVDRTEAYRMGAARAVARACSFGAGAVILKEKSPSCGTYYVYNGRFARKIIQGQGIASERFRAAGFGVYSEMDLARDAQLLAALCAR